MNRASIKQWDIEPHLLGILRASPFQERRGSKTRASVSTLVSRHNGDSIWSRHRRTVLPKDSERHTGAWQSGRSCISQMFETHVVGMV